MAQVKPKAPATKVPAKPEDLWNEARLIPTTGIGGLAEQEQRATSALLAVLRAVPEFGRALLVQAGAPAGRIRSYIEVQFPDDTGKVPRPDGAVIDRELACRGPTGKQAQKRGVGHHYHPFLPQDMACSKSAFLSHALLSPLARVFVEDEIYEFAGVGLGHRPGKVVVGRTDLITVSRNAW